MKKRFSLVAALSLSFGLLAANENLLENPDLMPAPDKPGAIADWSMDNGWVKGDIPSFQGFPFTMFYLARKDGGRLWQTNLPVEKNKWYTLETWYRGDLAPDPAGNLWLSFCRPTRDGDSLTFRERFAVASYGAVSDWVKLRAYVNTGEFDRVGILEQVFGQGDAALGRFSLRAFADADFQGPWFQDGGFEKGIVGKTPLEIPSLHARVTDKEAFRGGLSALLTIPAKNERNSFLLSPLIPATPGDKIAFSFMAKTPGPEVVVRATLTRQQHKEFCRARSGTTVGKDWKKIKGELTVPEADTRSAKLVRGVQTFRCYIDFDNAPEGTEIFVDELTATLDRKGDTDKQPVYGVPGNPLKNSSFEAGLDGWSSRFSQDYFDEAWPLKFGAATIDETGAIEGNRSLKIVIPKKDKGESSAQIRSVYLPVELDKPYTVSFWAKADVAAPVDVALKEWWRGVSKTIALVPNEWRRYAVTLVPKFGNDGFNYLSFAFKTPGTYRLDAIQVESGDKMTDYRPDGDIEIGADFAKTYPWYPMGEKPEIKVSYASRFSEDRLMKLSWTVYDWRKNPIDNGERELTLSAKTAFSEIMPMYDRSFGAFHVALTLSDPKSGGKAETDTVYGIFPEVRDMPPGKSSMGLHFAFDYGLKLTLPGGDLDAALSLFNMLGARWERSFNTASWKAVWPEESRWVWYDRYIDAFRAKGVSVMPILGWSMSSLVMPEWCLGDSPRADMLRDNRTWDRLPRLDTWKTYVRTLMTHYGEKIAAWEVWNETGALCPKSYVEFAKAAHEAVADIKDRPPLVGPDYPCQGLPYPDQDDTWIGQVFKLGFYSYVDILSAHYYPPGGNYGGAADFEGGTDRYGDREESLLKQIDNVWKTYGKKPLWDSESGVLGRGRVRGWEHPANSFNVRSASPEQQARRFVIWQVIRMAAGFERFFYHTLGYPGSPPGGYCHSLTEFNLSPSPITIAYAQLAKRLDDFKFEKRYRITPTIWTYVFTADNKTVGVYWNYAAEKDSEIRFPLTAKQVLSEDIMGNVVTPKVVPEGIELPLGLNPIYLISDKLTPDEMLDAFVRATPKGVKAVALAIGMADGPSIAVGSRNIVAWPVAGTVAMKTLPTDWEASINTDSFAVGKGADSVRIFPLTSYRPEGGKASAIATYDGEMTEVGRTLYLAEAKAAKVTVDGDIAAEEYGGSSAIVLNAAEQVRLPVYRGGKTLKPGYAWGGPEEGSAEIYAAWEPDTLFLGLKVKDDITLNDALVHQLWRQDSIEIYFDTDPTGNLFFPGVYSECQGRLTVAPPKADDGGRPRFAFEKTPGGKPRHFDIANAKFAYKKTAGGYNIEIALPTRGLTLKPGKVLGFFVNLNDIDKPGDDKVIVVWKKTLGDGSYNSDNSLWGYLSLKP